jgi:hypothetical protein
MFCSVCVDVRASLSVTLSQTSINNLVLTWEREARKDKTSRVQGKTEVGRLFSQTAKRNQKQNIKSKISR